MASTNFDTLTMLQMIRDHGDLATLLSYGTVDEEKLKFYAEHSLLEFRDNEGRTPLMIACWKGLEDVVKFLLENGANPNSKSLEEGNTPMHYACMEDNNRWRELNPTLRSRLPIVKLLVSHGAVKVVQNDHGWSPPCEAAYHKLRDLVEFFLAMDDDEVPLEEKIKIANLLAVSTALIHCNSFLKDIDPNYLYNHFLRAISLQQGAGFETAQPVSSELATRFAKVSWKECQTEEDLESIKESTLALKAQAFLIGDKIYPQSLKKRNLYPLLLHFADDLCYRAMWDEFFEVMSFAFGFERQGGFELGKVASEIVELFDCLKKPNEQYLQHVLTLLREYESAFEHVDIVSLSENVCSGNFESECSYDGVDSIVKSFGRILFYEAYYCSSVDILQSTLKCIERSVRIIRGRIQKENRMRVLHKMPSVAYEIMKSLPQEDAIIDPVSFRRVRYILLKILLWESASYKTSYYFGRNFYTNSDHSTLLHLLADYARNATELEASPYGCFLDISEYIIDLARAFVRHGCPTDAVNLMNKTAKEVFEDREDDRFTDDEKIPDEYKVFLSLLCPLTTVLTLEEIATRAVLRQNLKYQDVVPPLLCERVEGGAKDSDLVRE